MARMSVMQRPRAALVAGCLLIFAGAEASSSPDTNTGLTREWLDACLYRHDGQRLFGLDGPDVTVEPGDTEETLKAKYHAMYRQYKDYIVGSHKTVGEHVLVRLLALAEARLDKEPSSEEVAGYLFEALDWLAQRYEAEKRFDEALALRKRQVDLADQRLTGRSASERVQGRWALLERYRAAGENERVDAVYRQILALETRDKGRPETPTLLSYYGFLVGQKGREQTAASIFQQALALASSSPAATKTQAMLEVYERAGQALGGAGRLDQEADMYRELVDVAERAYGRDSAQLIAYLMMQAQAESRRGRLASAQALSERASALPGASEQTKYWSHFFLNLAWARGDLDQATVHAEQMVAMLEPPLRTLMNPLGTFRLEDFRWLFGWHIDLLISLALAAPSSGRVALAANALLRRKGLDVAVELNNIRAVYDKSDVSDDSLRAVLIELSRVRACQSALHLHGRQRLPQDGYELYRTRFELRTAELETIINVAQFSLETRVAIRLVDTEQIRQVLAEDQALLEWYRWRPVRPEQMGKDAWYDAPEHYVLLFVHRNREPMFFDLGPADEIDALVKSYRRSIPRFLTRTDELAGQLFKALLEPVWPHMSGVRHIFLAPDATLHELPFAALVDRRGQYLLDSFELSYLDTGRDLIRLSSTEQLVEPADARLVAFADPDYGTLPDTRGRGFNPLPRTADEVERVAALFPRSRIIRGAEATETAVKAVSSPTILHIASHGFTHINPPCASEPTAPSLDFSGLAMARANTCLGGGDDGLLTAREVSTLNLGDTGLVVLSACGTGVGEPERLASVVGLRSAFTKAGAATQVVSIWEVDDAATSELIRSFFINLTQGSGRAQALAEAQRAMRRSERWRAPYYWASMLVVGDPRPLLHPRAAPDAPDVPTPRTRRGCACQISSPGHSPAPSDILLACILALCALAVPRVPHLRIRVARPC